MYDVSIIVATYNSDPTKTLFTLRSCLAQHGVRAQLIVADDGSAKNNFDCVEAYLRSKGFSDYKLLGSKTNQGTVANVLRAVEVAESPYVKTISPGDLLYDSGTLLRMLSQMDAEKTTCSFGRTIFYSSDDFRVLNKQMPKDMKPYSSPSRIFDAALAKRNLLRNRDSMCGASLAYKTEDFARVLRVLQGNVRYCEDYSARLLFLESQRLSFVNDYVIWYEYGTGISTSGSKRSTDAVFRDWKSLANILSKIYPEDKDVKAMFDDCAIKDGGYPPVIASFLRAFRDPQHIVYHLRKGSEKFLYRARDYDYSKLVEQIDADEITDSIESHGNKPIG